MLNKNDFFFKTEYSSLYEINDIAKKVRPSFFTKQLNRYLAQNCGRMEIQCDTSSPPFAEFLSNIDKDQIENITIYCRTDLNDAVRGTLACDILLEQGIVSVSPHWCAYKDIRAEEIISTLLVPIHVVGLQPRVFLRKGDGSLEPLVEGRGIDSEIRAVFSLSMYPQQPESEYVKRLTIATDIGKENLSMNEALSRHYRMLNPVAE